MKSKAVKIAFLIILVFGMILRIYYVFRLPLLSDEKEFLQMARNVSFNFNSSLSWLAKDSLLGENVMLSVYGIKSGVLLIGESPLGIRLFSSLFPAILSLMLIYFFVKEFWGQRIALFSLGFMTFNQYYLTHSAIATQHFVRQLVILIVLLLFFRILKKLKKMISIFWE